MKNTTHDQMISQATPQATPNPELVTFKPAGTYAWYLFLTRGVQCWAYSLLCLFLMRQALFVVNGMFSLPFHPLIHWIETPWSSWLMPFSLIFALCVFLIVTLYLTTLSYTLTHKNITVRSGLIIKTEKMVPYDQLVGMDLWSNPLHRLLGIQSILLNEFTQSRVFVGGQYANTGQIFLRGLKPVDAKLAHQMITSKVKRW